ncbi:MAG: hypothetical protein HQ552_09175 [Desulfobacteraceae bacterium]|nr:hypothetical protein [Desulfobacteraceae bacterium]
MPKKAFAIFIISAAILLQRWVWLSIKLIVSILVTVQVFTKVQRIENWRLVLTSISLTIFREYGGSA